MWDNVCWVLPSDSIKGVCLSAGDIAYETLDAISSSTTESVVCLPFETMAEEVWQSTGSWGLQHVYEELLECFFSFFSEHL